MLCHPSGFKFRLYKYRRSDLTVPHTTCRTYSRHRASQHPTSRSPAATNCVHYVHYYVQPLHQLLRFAHMNTQSSPCALCPGALVGVRRPYANQHILCRLAVDVVVRYQQKTLTMAYDKKAFAGFVGSLVPRGTCLYHFVYGPVLAQSHLTPRAQVIPGHLFCSSFLDVCFFCCKVIELQL